MKTHTNKDKRRNTTSSFRSAVSPKKSLGQHFLNNPQVAKRIAQTLDNRAEKEDPNLAPSRLFVAPSPRVLEVGPGMGILTQFLWELPDREVKMVEIDQEAVVYLQKKYPEKTQEQDLIQANFLHMDLATLFKGEDFCLIGNFPYNISSQILFKAVENRERIPFIAGMFQKEVAERVVSGPSCKAYGIMSVWIQAFYEAQYLFTVEPFEFTPPPQVRSGVIRLCRKADFSLECNEKRFLSVVKTAFGQRRKTLRNALGGIENFEKIPTKFLSLRAEQLSVKDFVELTLAVSPPCV